MLYAAYGSNLNMAQMSFRIKNNKALPLYIGYIHNYKLVFSGNKYLGYFASIQPSENSQVPVLVYDIDDNTEKILDAAEGLDKGFYHKTNIEVNVDNNILSCITYIMNDVINNMPVISGTPKDSYIARILMGYYQLGFDIDYFYNCLNLEKYKKEQIEHLLKNPENIIDELSIKGAKSESDYGKGWNLDII